MSIRLIRGQSVKAFTLIELLVVVAIIALLAGLLFPALSTAKAKAKSVACQNQLKHMGLAMIMYVHDSGFYPADRDTVNNVQSTWMGRLAPYVSLQADKLFNDVYRPGQKERVFRCPELIFRQDLRQWRPSYYALNGYGTGNPNDPKRLGLSVYIERTAGFVNLRYATEAMVAAPSDMIAFGDMNIAATTDGRSSHSFFISDPNPIPWPALLHRKGANMVFCDGHLEWASQTNWMAPRDFIRKRWNIDNEPHPETWK